MDFISPFMPTPRGNHYIITVTDAFMKWPEARAIPDKTSQTVADFIYRLFCRHGCCKVQLSDRGTEFVNRTLDHQHELCGVERKLSSAAYQPQTNGQTERFNRMLVDTLKKVTGKEEGDLMLDPALFSYRTSKHDSTGFTPFMMMYGREARLPVDMATAHSTPCEEFGNTDTILAEKATASVNILKSVLSTCHAKGSDTITEKQGIQKKNYDKRHNLFCTR